MASQQTPMMQQFYQVKEAYPDCIVFFRLGDFYEMFGEDAEKGARILDITLTSRTKGENAIPMCGVPYHSAEGYILKLTHAGQKVAICEQVSDPSLPGLVQRDVVRVITPGTNINDNYLAERLASHVMAAFSAGDDLALAYADISTGELVVDQVELANFADVVQRVRPAELILPAELYEMPLVYTICQQLGVVVTKREKIRSAASSLCNWLGVERLEGFELDAAEDGLIIQAAANLLAYLSETQKRDLVHFRSLQRYRNDKYLALDATTIQNLELFYSQKEQQKLGSLFSVINQTVSKAGGRLLAKWLLAPLRDLTQIEQRQRYIDLFRNNSPERADLRQLLTQIADLQRLASRVALGQGRPTDLGAIRDSLKLAPFVKSKLIDMVNPDLSDWVLSLPILNDLKELLTKALSEQPRNSVAELGNIASGFNAEIDQLRQLHNDSEQILADFLAKEKKATGIANLKVGSNKVVGFYLEVSKGKIDAVPGHYITKQTLTNYNRYVTPELKEYEEKILQAEQRLLALEAKLCQELMAAVTDVSTELQSLGLMLAELDCWLGLAELAVRNRYVLPKIIEENNLTISQGRHPVVEQLIETGKFIANDVSFSDKQRLIVLTGPNMGGKSTYLRQTALIVLLAHIGSFVPATAATIPLTDRIFTRVGASDNLSKGQSTFMVEMQELAVILNNATDRSLLVIDEIGRGTSTYDGISIAWATLEDIHDRIGANTLFATHYHELIDVAEKMRGAANFSMAVHEEAAEVIFLHEVRPGGMNDSYGIEVAKRAGVPSPVVANSETKLKILEGGSLANAISKTVNTADQLPLFVAREHNPLRDEIFKLNIDEMTPMAALQKLAELKACYDADEV